MITGSQLRAARALLNMSQDNLAEKSGVSKPTIARMELGKDQVGGYASTREKLVAALEGSGVTFLGEGEVAGGGPGVRLRKTAPAQEATEADLHASSVAAHSKAADAVEEALRGADATNEQNAERRGALTDEPDVVAAAKQKPR